MRCIKFGWGKSSASFLHWAGELSADHALLSDSLSRAVLFCPLLCKLLLFQMLFLLFVLEKKVCSPTQVLYTCVNKTGFSELSFLCSTNTDLLGSHLETIAQFWYLLIVLCWDFKIFYGVSLLLLQKWRHYRHSRKCVMFGLDKAKASVLQENNSS